MNKGEKLRSLSSEQRLELVKEWSKSYEKIKEKKLNLDLTRGKPSADQVSICADLDGILKGDFKLQDGSDARNYGGLFGIPESRRLGAEVLGAKPEQVMACGNSSLFLMHQYAEAAHIFGLNSRTDRWLIQNRGNPRSRVKMLCPVPGYDRHFAICERLGIEMLWVEMQDDGPDMDVVEACIKADSMIMGIWCVPRFSNPTGITYSAEVVERFARLGKIANKNFRIFWDNAYAVHELVENSDNIPSLLALAEKEGTEDNVVMFASTSKITFAGGGISWLATSEKNLKDFSKHLEPMMIGPDKVNQLRHSRMFPDLSSLRKTMVKHAAILKPKFKIVSDKLESELADFNIANWTKPEGGYFVSFSSMPGLAKKIIQLAGEAGVKLTPAGSTWPFGLDPDDTNIRLAPSFPVVSDLEQAMDVFTLCVKLATIQNITEQNITEQNITEQNITEQKK